MHTCLPQLITCLPHPTRAQLIWPLLTSTHPPRIAQVGIVTGGLLSRQDKLRKEAEEAWQKLREATTELECFRCADFCWPAWVSHLAAASGG